MKRASTLLQALLLVVLVAATGCTDTETAEPGPAAGGETAEIELTGDFDGPVGLQLWSLRNELQEDVPGTLDWIRRQGIREVELAGTYGMTPEAFRRELDAAGLDATAMHVGYDMLRDSLQTVLDRAETLGAERVGTAWIPHPEDRPFDAEMARQAAADFNAWGEAAAERGIQFYYHNHGFEFQPTASGETPMDILMAETDPENVKFEMDVLWTSLPGVDAAELLRKYPDRWELMHIKDLAPDWPLGSHEGHAPPEAEVPVGQGQIDYAEVLQAAEEIGLDHYYIEDETTAPMENIPTSIEFLETVTYD